MSFDIGKVAGHLGEEAVARAGEPLGLDKDQSNRVVKALAARAGLGGQEAIAAAAADTGIDEEVVSALTEKLVEAGKEKLMEESGATAAVDAAKDQAMAAVANAGGGLLGRLFGRK
jgi:hypothetical protein